MRLGSSLTLHVLEARLILDVPVRFYHFPGFVLHGVLGRKLRQFSCALKRPKCDGCPLQGHCAYAFFFISPRSQNPDVLPGRANLPHPWFLQVGQDFYGHPPIKRLDLRIILMGKAIHSAPILLLALREAGKEGVLESRIPFKLEAVRLNGSEWSSEFPGHSDNALLGKQWTFQIDTARHPQDLKLHLITPLRLKVNGNYCDHYTSKDILRAAHERLATLSTLYGQAGSGDLQRLDFSPNRIIGQKLKWLDYSRWSGRQKTTMKLGGAVGVIEIRNLVEPGAFNLLAGAELAGLGKNTSFGLGEVKMSYE